MTMQFTMEGLCCPVCASKIEEGIRKLDGVTAAALDFSTQRLTMEIADPDNSNLPAANHIIEKARGIVKQIESDVVMVAQEIPGRKAAGAGAVTAAETAEDPDEDEAGMAGKKWLRRAGMGAGVVFFIAGLLIDFGVFDLGRFTGGNYIELAVFLAAYLLIGGEVLLRAFKNIFRGQVFDENFLMSLATIGAFAIGEYPEGVAVMLFYQIGEAFQAMAVRRSRNSISALMDIRPDFANIKRDGEIRRVSPDEVQVGECIVVKPGEKIPLDGVVAEGSSALDTSALTGEALPRDVTVGSDVLSGSINKSGLLLITVTREFGESTVSKILEMVQNAGSKKAPIENFITKFARYYTPAVVIAAAALAFIPPLFLPGAEFANWLRRGLVFLVVSCPCALVISIPLSFFGGIGGASKNGILVKGGNYLEALNKVDAVVFDKTGTLTRGIFTVTEIHPAEGRTNDELLFLAAAAESSSNHPIALSIQKAYGKAIDSQQITSYEEIAGKGIRIELNCSNGSAKNKIVLAGNRRLLEEAEVSGMDLARINADDTGTIVCIADNGLYAGYIVIADEVKPDSRQAVADLRKLGVRQIAMLTGDNRAAAEKIGAQLGLDAVYADLLPHQKVEQLEALEQNKQGKGKLVFVGDGINDAPVLARSDIGIAMGGLGADAAIEAADIVLMTDEPSKLTQAIRIARRTHGIVMQNVIFALGVKAVILALGAAGIATMWAAVFGDVGVALIAVLNAARALQAPGAKRS
ncbi:MAG: heavy metal translocating P-type ATPase [Treponema sp.]|jgi:Cd2+/Zn2+-exporting ATPase|nr:heavy metal translocating P-type ATPase [Treponema sp.]